jgi:hypothetical protein
MAVQNLQSLVQRAARGCDVGVRATGLESKDLFAAVVGNSAQAPSSSWHPLSGPYPIRTGPESAGGHRMKSMDTPDRRAGRSAGTGGVISRIGFARIGRATILSSWSRTEGTSDTPWACRGCPKPFGASPALAGNRLTGRARGLQAMPEALA